MLKHAAHSTTIPVSHYCCSGTKREQRHPSIDPAIMFPVLSDVVSSTVQFIWSYCWTGKHLYTCTQRPSRNRMDRNRPERLTISRNGTDRLCAGEVYCSNALMNTKSVVKSTMIATVYRVCTTTSPIPEASLTWENTPKQSNSSEIGKDTKVRHDNQDPRTTILPAPYSVPPFLFPRIFSSLMGQTWLARLNFSYFGFTGGRLLANSFFRRIVEEFDGHGDHPNALLTCYFVSTLHCIALWY